MTPNDILTRLQRSSALLNGHFLLSSGLHSDSYVQCALLLQYPDDAEAVGVALAGLLDEFAPERVLSPAIGGIVIGQEVARALSIPHQFVEKQNGVPTLRRGFSLKKGERVVVVEDVVTTGRSTKEVIELARLQGAIPVAVGSIIDRSAGHADFDMPYRSLLELDFRIYKPDECPLCEAGVPLYKPGSRQRK